MMTAKSGDWMRDNPQRRNANLSAYILPDSPRGLFDQVIANAQEYGDPGFYFTCNPDFIPNPCVEIGMYPFFYDYVREGDEELISGFSFCNLNEVPMNPRMTNPELERCVQLAAVLGTIQSLYTDFPTLGGASQKIAERDRLLGVALGGMMDDFDRAFSPQHQRRLAAVAVEANKMTAALLEISPAKRTTCEKPSGTLSLATFGEPCGCGVHPHPAKRYFRRVIANHLEAPFQVLRETNPQACYPKLMADGTPHPTDWIVNFPVETDGKTLDDFTAIEFLELVELTQQNWVEGGNNGDEDARGLSHNVSTTVLVKDHEWQEVSDWIWNHRGTIASVALVSDYGLLRHPDVPRQPVTPDDEAEWARPCSLWRHVDYSRCDEFEDHVVIDSACEGPLCEVNHAVD